MCKQSKTTQSTQLPGYVNDAGKLLVQAGTDLVNKPFEPYTADRVADFSGDQTDAFQQLRNLIAGAPNVGPEVLQGFRTAAAAPAQQLSTERVVDEGGRLGAISDYMNPNIDAVLAPVLRTIQEQADKQRQAIGARATTAGAYGDARHGVTEAMLGRDTTRAMGDAANKVFSDAYNAAMGLRTGDISRMGSTDLANAQFGESALNRLMTGSAGIEGQAGIDQQRLLTQIQALLGTGGIQQQLGQSGLDKAYEEFLRGYGNDFNVINALAGALKSTPHDTTVTTSQPNNSGLAFLGSMAGSAISNPAVQTALMAMI